MNPERWRTVQEVFAAATERDASSRSAFLDEACRGDPELRAEVESLLSSLGTVSPSFLESPAIEVEGVTAAPAVEGAGRRVVGKGTRLGPYEILSPLGSGGMGEVYRARDDRLGRDVAIKVLSADSSLDAARVQRFEKEARSASALNHPNIVTVYDVGSSDGLSYIAMEKVNGETLRALVSGGPVPIKKLLPIATQIADGLARAHEAAIVHRDLKPENVMVTNDGLVKILDFGLAKLSSTGSGSDEGSHLSTATGTTPGVIMGTVGYMSPEQANGAKVDFRSDQFSFGSILYEMVTGRPAFQGKTPIDVLGAILNDEPQPLAAVQPQVPTQLRWIVERCLAKEPRQRYAATDDLARDLAKLRDHLSEATTGVAPSRAARRRRAVPALIVGAAALAIAAIGLLRRPTPAPRQTIRFAVPAPPNTSIAGGNHSFAFSPDGSQLAFRAGGEPARIWLRPLAAAEARPIPGTENVDSLFWSPDGRSIGYFATGKLWRVDVSGSAPIPVCDVNAKHMYVGSWGSGGQIVFSRFPGDAIYSVSTSEGRPAAIVKPDKARGEMTVAWPWFLPDGKSFLYLSQDSKGGSLMLSSPGGPSRRLLSLLSRAEYIEPGYLVFVRGGTLFAQRFDARQGVISGEPSSIADAVRYSQGDGFGAFATSLSGAIASATLWKTPRYRMGWFDRTGRAVDRLESLAPLGLPGVADVALDPAGRRVLFDRTDPKTRTRHLWILDLETKTEVRVTSDETDEHSARWLPDGKSIVFTAGTGGMVQLRRRDLTTGHVEPLLPYGEDQQAGHVVSGGTQLLYETVTDEGNAETRFVDLSGDHKTTPLPRATAFDEAGGYSPDGRLILVESGASGRDEIYVALSASPTERIPVSSGGALHGVAVWSRDGSEVFYLSPQRQLISVPIHETPSLSVGKPTVLFTTSADAAWDVFDVSPDGKRFLAVYAEGVPESVPLDVVLNWTASLEGRPAR